MLIRGNIEPIHSIFFHSSRPGEVTIIVPTTPQINVLSTIFKKQIRLFIFNKAISLAIQTELIEMDRLWFGGLGMRLSTSIVSITRVEVVTQNAGCERPIKYLALLPLTRFCSRTPFRPTAPSGGLRLQGLLWPLCRIGYC